MDNSVFVVEPLGADDLSPSLIAAWRELERGSLEPNAYLSPDFVLPALRHLDPGIKPSFVAVQIVKDDARQLVGFGVFSHRPMQWRVPLRRLSAYVSKHSFLSGLLVHRQHADAVLAAFVDFFSARDAPWDCVELRMMNPDGALVQALGKAAARQDLSLAYANETRRAVLEPAGAGRSAALFRGGGNRLKELKRQRRRLATLGNLTWRCLSGRDFDFREATNHFARLENTGWKANIGTALQATPKGDAFLRDMTEGFGRDGRLFFTELVLDGVPIASTCNLLSGTEGFAFKIGWDPAHAQSSPGLLNELCFLEQAPALMADVTAIDSGAAEGSFIESLWTDSKRLATILLPVNRRAALVLGVRSRLRWMRQILPKAPH